MSTPARPAPAYDLHVDVAREQHRVRLALRGELDLASSSILEDAVSRACTEGVTELVLDIGALTFIDSTGLRAILMSRTNCERAGCSFAVAPAPDDVRPQVRRLLQVTGLLARLPFGAEDDPPA